MEQVTQAVNDELVASLDYKLATGNTNYVQSRKSIQYDDLAGLPHSADHRHGFPRRRVGEAGLHLPELERLQRHALRLPRPFVLHRAHPALCQRPARRGHQLLRPFGLHVQPAEKRRVVEGAPVGGPPRGRRRLALPVQPGQKRDVLMAPHLIGMFNCGKMLPPQLNLVLEIQFAEPEMAMRAGVGSSLDYQIENVHLLADQVTLDSALRESFERILLSNRSLVFSFPSLHVQQSSIPAGSTNYNVTVARAFTKLLGAFVTFNKTGENHVSNFEYPGEAFPNVSAATVMEGQLQLGSLQFPRNSIKSIAEYHHFLELMSGTYDSKIRNMRLFNYDNTQFVAAFPTERVPKHPTSGISTRSGDLCRFTFRNMLADRVDSIYIGLVSMQIVTLSGSGVSVLD